MDFGVIGRVLRRGFLPGGKRRQSPPAPPVINIEQGGTGNLLPMVALGGLAVWLLTRK